MSGISGIGSSPSTNYYGQIASGRKLLSAANGAAELSIAEKQKKLTNGVTVGNENISHGQSALNIADGALSGITESLQDIRELALKASNGILSYDDRRAIQDEVDAIRQGIGDTLSQAKFNETPLLSGGEDITIYAGAEGSVIQLANPRFDLSSLGIENFNVLEDFDIGEIDRALDLVSGARSRNGAESNALSYAYRYNAAAAENLTASRSRLEDADIGQTILELRKRQNLDQVQLQMQKKRQEQQARLTAGFFSGMA